MSKTKIYFPNLDGLRFFCFLSVFFFHSFATGFDYILKAPLYHFIKKDVFGNGNLGVNFFFVLSGFLITYLLIKEKELNNKISIPKFWMRRILRIWPLYYGCVIFGFVAFPLLKRAFGQVPDENAHILNYLTFTSNFDMIHNAALPDASVLGVLWSIAVEEQFYFFWPILLAIVPIKRYPVLFLSIIGGTLIFRAFNDNYWSHEIHSFSCIGDMAVGAMGAYFANRTSFREAIENMHRGLILALYAIFAVVYFFRDELLQTTHLTRIFERSFIAVIIIFIILEQNYAKNSLFKLSRFKRITQLGVISYGLYCLHFIGILITITLTRKAHFNTHLWQVMVFETVLALTLTIIIARLSYKYYETPFLRLKDKFAYFVKSTGASA